MHRFLKESFVLLYSLESYNNGVSPKKRLDDVMHLAELCIEVLQQNEEHHAEVRFTFTDSANTLFNNLIADRSYQEQELSTKI